MPYTPQQLAQLKLRCNQLHLDFIIRAINEGAVTLDELPLTPERRTAIETTIRNTPNAAEQAAWDEICQLREAGSDAALLEEKLNQYVADWKNILPPRNHVDEATGILFSLMEEREKAAWEAVDQSSYESLHDYIATHPTSPYTLEAEDLIWECSRSFLPDLQRYLNDFPTGRHVEEARAFIAANAEWERLRGNASILDLVNYLRANPSSPYAPAARQLLEQKKEDMLTEMIYNPSKFKLEDVRGLLDYGVLSENDLTARGILTPDVLNRIRTMPRLTPPKMTALPDLSGKDGATDIYLFGIPSSGKTCVLSGLLGSQRWSNIDLIANGAGDYIEYLELCRRTGVVPERTDGDFVALIRAQVKPSPNSKVVHRINLVDMAGEDFATKIVKNRDAIVSFADMGRGVPELLSNHNRKVFFIIIDPSSDGIISFERKDAAGHPVIGPDGTVVRDSTTQDLVLRRMLGMISAPENAHILKYVDAIHFIMAKADKLGPREVRDDEALIRFRANYGMAAKDLIPLCQKHNINGATDGHPVLHTFSLGRFYIGGVYSYDVTDADKLVDILCNVTHGVKTGGMFNF